MADLTERDQRDIRLVMLLVGNATFLQSIAAICRDNATAALSIEMMGFMSHLVKQFGDGNKLMHDVKNFATDIGIHIEQFQCGSEKVH